MNLPILPQDKANHWVYGGIIYAVAYLLSLAFPIITFPAAYVALAIVALFAVGKEALDAYMNTKNPGSHGVELNDALATIAGSIVVAAPLVLPNLIK
jgi:uncharacterized membrane protein HdeD (DUF308 family)